MRYCTIVDKSEQTLKLIIEKAEEYDKERVLNGLDMRHCSAEEVQMMATHVTEYHATLQKEIVALLTDLTDFCQKIDDLLASGYDPKLDDGVGKNIPPLQKRQMLSYEVLNAGQLKKYLNADW